MTNPIRDIQDRDLDWVHALNQENAIALSPLSRNEMAALIAAACYARVADGNAGFLIAFDQQAIYDSPNYRWFRQRLNRFVYIDRIAVAELWRGRGLARALYDNLFAYAAAAGHASVVCEVNAKPPNPDSDAFHTALGFQVIGEAPLPDRGKTVRYWQRPISPSAAV